MNRAHAHPEVIEALIRAAGAQKQAVALAADMSAPAFSNVLAGRRHAFDDSQRAAIAAGLTTVIGVPITPRTVTCVCDDPASHPEQP